MASATGGSNVYLPIAVVTDPFGFSDITGLTINVAPLGTTPSLQHQ